jgi:hypothetical protein
MAAVMQTPLMADNPAKTTARARLEEPPRAPRSASSKALAMISRWKELTDKKQKEVQSAQPVPIESKRQDADHRIPS